jgi:Tol biopolymer transport system component
MKQHSSFWLMGIGVAGTIAVSACGKGAGTGALPAARALGPDSASLAHGSYSPDGSRVAYWAEQADSEWLEIAKADLSDPRAVAANPTGGFGTPPPPLWSPDGHTIAFPKIGALMDAWIAPVDGGSPRRLTDAPGIEQPVEWAPSGDRLAYLASGQGGTVRMYVLNTTTMTSSPMLGETRTAFGSWSPDGTAIAYVLAGGGGTTTLWLADSTGGNARQLTKEGFEDFGETSPWSPDGTRLLYTSRRTGTRDVWVMPVAGGEPLQLTRDVRDDYAPVWSPDGQWVAFLSDRGRQTDVWLVPANGGTEIRVTDNTDVERTLRWRPEANELKYEILTQREALWARSLADGSERRLTPDPVRLSSSFDVTRDGSKVVYAVIRGGGVLDLLTLPVAGGTPETLVSNSSSNNDPHWSPDGSMVAFTSNRTGNNDVWVVDAAGGTPRALTSWPSDESSPRWTPDGSGIYFLSDHESGLLPDLWLVPAAGGEPRRVTHSGKVFGADLIPHSPDLILTVLGDKAGEITKQRMTPDGTMHPLWDRSNALGVALASPDGKSLAVFTIEQDGSRPTWLLSLATGKARQILRTGEGALDWSPDGSRLLYTVGGAVPDLAILTIADSTVQRVTNTPDRREWGAKWTPDGESIVIAGGTSQNRMYTVDVGSLIAR